MKINEWLETKGINSIDEITLEAIEEFIHGSHLAVGMESLQAAIEQNVWVRKNSMTKREQFAGFALIGLADSKRLSTEKVNEAFVLADRMLEKSDESDNNS